jgi:hypothetical protein
MPGKRAIRTLLARAIALLLATATGIGAAHADGRDGDEEVDSYAIGLWGDMPYSDVQAQTGVPNLIADMNSQKLKFSVFDGDWKAGNAIVGSATPTSCSNELYAQSLAYLNTLKAPAMFTPGDNDWTDCDRPKNGAYNSLERLDYERALFFSTPYSFGMKRMKQDVQTGFPYCMGVGGNAVSCVENRRWMVGKVVYVTLNVQGSCNNLCDTAPNPAEFAARNAANIFWMKEAFAYAKQRGAAALMIISQADPGFSKFEFDAPLRDPITLAQTDGNPDGFQEFLLAVRNAVVDFALLPHRQADAQRAGSAARELHPRRNLRRQRGQRQQRHELGQGHGGPAQPRGLFVHASDCAGQPGGGAGALSLRRGARHRARAACGLPTFRQQTA